MSKSKPCFLKNTLTDIFAMNTFSYVVSVPIELLISGMSFTEHLQVRFVALILNTLVARPFGIWRSFILGKFCISENSLFLRNYLADTTAFLLFQLPLYVGNLVLGGADTDEIIKAGLTVSIIAGLLGRPYGIYLDWIKSRVGLTTLA
jgi:hypothetical protein